MTVEEARKIIGKEARGMSDDQVSKMIDDMRFMTESMFDLFMKMSPKERLKYSKKITTEIVSVF